MRKCSPASPGTKLIGAADQSFAANFSRSVSRAASASGSVASKPRELLRSGSKIWLGGAIRPGSSAVSNGSAGDEAGRHLAVGDHVDERAIGAVLQQPPHQIGEQIGMPADWCIDAGLGAVLIAQYLVQPLAHPMQALELELRFIGIEFLDQMQHGSDRMRIVRGELRIEAGRASPAAFAHWRCS